MSDISPREPWPGYADLDESAREELLAKKFQQAKDQNDQDYALAIASAVANYEMLTAQTLMLPLFPGLTDDQQDYVIDRVSSHVTALAA